MQLQLAENREILAWQGTFAAMHTAALNWHAAQQSGRGWHYRASAYYGCPVSPPPPAPMLYDLPA
eukprot:7901371-Alexandrium_andersonii.AAC.1